MIGKLVRAAPPLAALCLLAAQAAWSQESRRLDLNGDWFFATDPLRAGEQRGWSAPGSERIGSGWDVVRVPHAWPTDPRYQYTGTAWYRRAFRVPAEWEGQHVRLAFDAAFYRARVWVNGEYLGEHEGGYTPFAFDATPHVRPGEENVVAVAVDNSWDLTTIPGARPGSAPSQQVYPWWDYGGLVRDVYLLASPPLYVDKQKVETEPDLRRGTARVQTTVWVTNASDRPRTATVALEIRREKGDEPVASWSQDRGLRTTVTVPARGTRPVTLAARLSRGETDLWHPDRPELYRSRALVWEGGGGPAAASSHALVATFGIRRVEVRDGQLLLNGEPIRMGGANRPSDHPEFGLVEPDRVIDQDMRLMKEAGMELSRINHYASPPNLLDWADRHGMLIIPEAGNWQLAPEQMDDPGIRENFRRQMREMVERDWNHPSVIGWSVGNEYPSDTPAGVRWTRDMSDHVRSLDDTRLVLFVAIGGTVAPTDLPREQRSFHYSDLIAVNLYSSPRDAAGGLDRVHATWPDKPVLVTEFGQRADQHTAEERVRYAREFVQMLRERPFISGASVWTFNDYRSRYPGTHPNGYRPWGVVDPEREPRPMYFALREEFSPVVAELRAGRDAAGAVTAHVRLRARNDFPRYTLRGYSVRYRLLDSAGGVLHEETRALDVLRPGESTELTLAAPRERAAGAATARIDVVRPTGFSVLDRSAPVAAATP